MYNFISIEEKNSFYKKQKWFLFLKFRGWTTMKPPSLPPKRTNRSEIIFNYYHLWQIPLSNSIHPPTISSPPHQSIPYPRTACPHLAHTRNVSSRGSRATIPLVVICSSIEPRPFKAEWNAKGTMERVNFKRWIERNGFERKVDRVRIKISD